MNTPSRYRPEIDGLRAFAVFVVIINHFNKDILPSGYLGVDIFFVISGYVITSSLASRKPTGFRQFLALFYERRIRRLVPALIVFVLCTSLLLSFFAPDPIAALGIGWRSLFGISNIQIYQASTDYFSEAAELNPFLHTWSLGVEEQFYLVFPLLIWLSGFYRQTLLGAKNFIFIIGVLSGLSLLAFIYLYQSDQPAAYFLMPTRFWEMAAGSLIFLGLHSGGFVLAPLEKIYPIAIIFGLLIVFYLPTSLAVPATILTVILTALLLITLKRGQFMFGLLTSRRVVRLGLISYSLYLWHWSVLSLSRWTIGIFWWTIPFQAFAIWLISEASYKYVESPFRSGKAIINPLNTIAAGLTGLLLSAAFVRVGLASNTSHLYLGNNETKTSRFEAGIKEIRNYIGPITGRKQAQCSLLLSQINDHFFKKILTDCLWSPEKPKVTSRPTVVYLGNSHAQQLFPVSEEVAETGRYSVVNISVGHCTLPYMQGLKHPSGKSCAVMDQLPLLAMRHIKNPLIFVIATHVGPDYSPVQWNEREYVKSFARLSGQIGRGNVLIYVAPNPKFYSLVSGGNCSREWFRPYPKCITRQNANQQRVLRKSYLKALHDVSLRHPNFMVLDPFDVLCGETNGYCMADRDGANIYWDPSHLTVKGVLLTKELHITMLHRAVAYLNSVL